VLKFVRREKVKYPVVFIGTGSCGLIAGAGERWQKFKITLKKGISMPKLLKQVV
jgi:hypothetical protein